MDNVVTVIFDVESESYQAFHNLRTKPFGEDYTIAEAALIKREGDTIKVAEAFDAAGHSIDDAALGTMVGAFAGILGGPLGVLFGASVGELIGTKFDVDDMNESASMLEITALKLMDKDAAIVALVQEEEPAFDAAFEGFENITIVRQYAADVLAEVEAAREVEAELANLSKEMLRQQRVAAAKAKQQELRAKAAAKLEAAQKERERREKELDEGWEMANAEFVNATKEMMGN